MKSVSDRMLGGGDMRAALVLGALLAAGVHAAAGSIGGPPDLRGTWLLAQEGDVVGEWALLEIAGVDGGPLKAEVRGVQKVFRLQDMRAEVAATADALVLTLTNGHSDLSFRARLEGSEAGDRIAGAMQMQLPQMPVRVALPAVLVRMEIRPLAEPGKPGAEQSGGLGAGLRALAEAQRAAAIWKDSRFIAATRGIATGLRIVEAIDVTTEERVWAAQRLAEAWAGEPEAAEAIAAVEALKAVKAELEDEKRPLEDGPALIPGARRAGSDRVVLLELFTGAECGPCVPADLASDALAEAYPADRLIVLQYHLHIPRPDPLTNADGEARKAYYEVTSTPTTLFNGRKLASGGGPREAARAKRNQYRRVVEGMGDGQRDAGIDLKAWREGETVRVEASARIENGADVPQARLRLVLVEDEVHYPGGNGIETHRRVVRGFLGGVDGVSFQDGAARIEATCALDAFRDGLNAYLDAYPDREDARGEFPRARPPIALERLSVVGIVQDDTGKEILHGSIVPVEDAAP